MCQDKESSETEAAGYPAANGHILLEDWEEGGFYVKDPKHPAGEIILCGPNVANGYLDHERTGDNTAFFTDAKGFETGATCIVNPHTVFSRV